MVAVPVDDQRLEFVVGRPARLPARRLPVLPGGAVVDHRLEQLGGEGAAAVGVGGEHGGDVLEEAAR